MTPAKIFTLGGTVQAGDGLYLSRKADAELLDYCRNGEYVYILFTRQVGKSSVMANAAEQLGDTVQSVNLDLTKIGTQVSPEKWYLGLLAILEEDLLLETDALAWWQEHDHLGLTQRLTDFVEHVVLHEVTDPVVIFVDEIDTTLSLDFTDDFFAAIRYLYNARANNPELKRLSFVLAGVATPNDLIKDPDRTPFNIGRRLDLTDFSFEEALPLAGGLGLPEEDARRVLRWVLNWSGGHPYLTQRLCSEVADRDRSGWTRAGLDAMVVESFFGQRSKPDPNLQFVRDMLTRRIPSGLEQEIILSTYRSVLRRWPPVADEERSLVKSHLKLSGVVRREGSRLRVRNAIYRRAFDSRWIRGHLPVNWVKRLQKTLAALVVALFVLSAPLAGNLFLQLKALREQKDLADEAAEIAEVEKARAEEATASAKEATASAVEAAKWAVLEKQRAEVEAARAEQSAKEAEDQRQNAVREEALAKLSEQRAMSAESRADRAAKNYRDFSLRFAERQGREDLLGGDWQNALAPLSWLYSETKEPSVELRFLVARAARFLDGLLYQLEDDGAVLSVTPSRAVTTSADETAKVWDLRDGSMLFQLAGHSGNVIAAAFSDSGDRIATLGEDGTARLWDARTGRRLAQPAGDLEGARSLTFSPDSAHLRAGGTVVWNVADGRLLDLSGSPEDEIRAFFSPSGIRLLVRTAAGTVFRDLSGPEPAEFDGHSGKLTAIALNADGSRLVTAGDDGTARLWDTSGRFVASFEGHVGEVRSAVFAGDRVVTVDQDNTVRVWAADETRPSPPSKQLLVNGLRGGSTLLAEKGEPRIVTYEGLVAEVRDGGSGRLLHRTSLAGETWDLHTAEVYSADFSPDGTQIVTASADGTARIWDARKGELIQTLRGSSLHDARFVLDGTQILVAEDRSVGLWDARTGRRTALLEPLEVREQQMEIHLSRDLTRCAIGEEQRPNAVKESVIEVFDLERESLVSRIPGRWPPRSTAHGGLSSDGERIIAIDSARPNFVRVWSTTTGREVASLGPHRDPISSAEISNDGKRAVIASGNKVSVWEIRGRITLPGSRLTVPGRPPRSFDLKNGHRSSVRLALFSPDDSRIATISRDSTAILWDSAKGKLLFTLTGHRGINAAVFSPDGEVLVTVGEDGAVFWNVHDGSQLDRFEGQVYGATFNADGTLLLTDLERKVKFWDAVERRQLRTPEPSIFVAVRGPEGAVLVTAGTEEPERVRLWNAETGKLIATAPVFHQQVGAVQLSPDGRWVAIGSGAGELELWDSGEQRLILQGHSGPVVSATFSSDGQTLISTSEDKTAILWRVEDGTLLHELADHRGVVLAAAFHPGGARVATAGKDKTAKIWDLETGKLLLTLSGHTSDVTDLALSPDGTWLLTASRDKTAKVWLAADGTLMATLNDHREVVRAVFHGDGRSALTLTADGSVLRWNFADAPPPQDLAQRVRELFPKRLEQWDPSPTSR